MELLNIIERIDSALDKRIGLVDMAELLIDCRSKLVELANTITVQDQRPVRVLRVLEYVGSRKVIDNAIASRGVKGTYAMSRDLKIHEAIIGETYEIFTEKDEDA